MDQWIFASMHELIRFVREDCSGDVVMTILMQLCDTPVPLCATVLRRRWRHTGSTQWYLDWCPRLRLCEPPAKVPVERVITVTNLILVKLILNDLKLPGFLQTLMLVCEEFSG